MIMKASFGTAVLLSAALVLGACKGEEDKSNNNGVSTEAQDVASLREQYLLALDLPTTRNGAEFTVSVEAYCNKLPKNDNYVAACTEAAQDYVDTKFGCSRFPLAPGGTRIDNQDVLARGLQGNYKEFPTQYLYTDEELDAAIELDQTRFNKNNFFVITDVSDLDAAATIYPQGVPNPGPQCE